MLWPTKAAMVAVTRKDTLGQFRQPFTQSTRDYPLGSLFMGPHAHSTLETSLSHNMIFFFYSQSFRSLVIFLNTFCKLLEILVSQDSSYFFSIYTWNLTAEKCSIWTVSMKMCLDMVIIISAYTVRYRQLPYTKLFHTQTT